MATVHSRSRPNRTATKISSWNPRPHFQDATIKAHDFAYATGVPDPTALSQALDTLTTVLAPLITQPILLQTLALIFGGCCSNVYTLESILNLSSDTGTLITCLQFIFIAVYTLPSQLTFHVTSPPEPPPLKPTQIVWIPRLKSRRVPLRVWVLYAAQFAMINVLNNAAFGYKISLPLHIILRSAGPVASMLVGWVWMGKSYGVRKVAAVLLLFAGVVLAALSDAGVKPSSSSAASGGATKQNMTSSNADSVSPNAPSNALVDQGPGFALLTLALFLSAAMGIWADGIYSRYGRTAKMADEQLFYGHLLSLPFFLFRYTTLQREWSDLMIASSIASSPTLKHSNSPSLQHLLLRWSRLEQAPKALVYLFLNCVTQMACISGVHRLSTQTSALTVSIVLNVRKVISLLLSIYLFGNELRLGVLIGAVTVFLGGGMYGLPEKKTESNEKKNQ